MSSSVVSLALLTFLHDVFTAFWIGGLMALAITVAPASRKSLGKESTMLLMDAIMKRLSPVIYGCMVGLAVTGAMLSKRSPRFDGLFSFATPYSAMLSLKHLAMLAMVAVSIFRSLGVKRLKLPPPRKNLLSMGLLMINLILGVLILLLSGFVSALA